MKLRVTDSATITLLTGDITQQSVDAIVNAANPTLYGGGGVDGAIHNAGGPQILEECRIIREQKWPKGLPTGEAVATTAGQLQAKHIIHTVGPIWHGGTVNESEHLSDAYRNSLNLAESLHLNSAAFPSISTGVYGYPVELAARIALGILAQHLHPMKYMREVRMVLFQRSTLKTYCEAATELAVRHGILLEP